LLLVCNAVATTPFSYQFYNSDGSAQTNAMTMTAWPPSTNAWTVYGTNIIWGSQTITLATDTNGYGTNHAYPNTYRIFVTNLNSGFFVSLPDTTNQIALGSCLTAAPQVAGPVGFFGMVTNWLGFAPSTNSNAGIVAALGYTPATNTYTALTNILGYGPATNTSAGLIAALGFQPATNGLAALTNTLTSAAVVGVLGFQPATNSLAALTNLLTSAALVGELGFQPATNAATMTNVSFSVIVPGSTTNILHITNGVINRIGNP
jgi:hypothetical protein